jgi:hypothetical protein
VAVEGPEFILVTLFTRVKISIGKACTFLGVIGTLGIKPKAVIGRDRISRRISIEP